MVGSQPVVYIPRELGLFFMVDLPTIHGDSDQLSRRTDQLRPSADESVLFTGILYLILSDDWRIIEQ